MADDDDDKVGYGKPPKASRFKPGRSGNAMGRPRSNGKADDSIGRLARKKIKTRNGQTIPLTEGVWSAQAQKALQGDVRSAQMLLDAIATYERAAAEPRDDLSKEDRKIFDRVTATLKESGAVE
ncbi:MAG: DUF5681 domain-containing protein [Methylocystis sp.]